VLINGTGFLAVGYLLKMTGMHNSCLKKRNSIIYTFRDKKRLNRKFEGMFVAVAQVQTRIVSETASLVQAKVKRK